MAVLALNLMHDIAPAHGRTARRGWMAVSDRGASSDRERTAPEDDVQGHLMAPRHVLPDHRRDDPLRYP